MAASSIIVNGRRRWFPAAYSEINFDGLDRKLPAQDRLVILGESEGGIPVTETDPQGDPWVMQADTPSGLRSLVRSGPLRDAGLLAFNPTTAGDIPNGPSSILMVKVNPATEGTATLVNGGGGAIDLTTLNFGAFVNQAYISMGNGTNRGFSVEIGLEDSLETGDDIGGTGAFSIAYAGEATTMSAAVSATGVAISFTEAINTTPYATAAAWVGGSTARAVSVDVEDNYQKITIYGVLAGAPVSETIDLNGSAQVATTQTYTTVTAVSIDGSHSGPIEVEDSNPTVAFTLAATLANPLTPLSVLKVVSSDATDIGQRVTFQGYDGSDQFQTETLTLNGTTVVTGAQTWNGVLSARLDSVTVGNVAVEDVGNPLWSVTAGDLTAGVNEGAGRYVPDTMAFDGVITFLSSAAGGEIVVRGISTAGTAVVERLTVPANPATVASTAMDRVDQIELGTTTPATMLTLSGLSINLPIGQYGTVGKVVDAISPQPGFTATALVDGPATFNIARMDASTQNVYAPAVGTFLADDDALIEWITFNSRIFSAVRATGATGPPSIPLAGPGGRQYASGGTEGVTANSNWQAGFDALKRKKNVMVVPISSSASIHAMCVSHCLEMSGAGRDERQCWLGLSASLDKAGVKSAIQLLNSDLAGIAAQNVTVFGEDGAEISRAPEYLAAMYGGMALGGKTIATPLTNKTITLRGVTQDVSWDPFTNRDEMIKAGVCLVYRDDERGFLVARDVTSFRDNDNPIRNAFGAMRSALQSTKNARNNLQTQIGKENFDGRVSTLRSLTYAEYQRQVDEGDIKAYDRKSLNVQELGDTYYIEIAVAPIEGVNFIVLKPQIVRINSAA